MSWVFLQIHEISIKIHSRRCLPFGRTTMEPCFPLHLLTGLLRTSWLEVGSVKDQFQSCPVMFLRVSGHDVHPKRERQKVASVRVVLTAPLLRHPLFMENVGHNAFCMVNLKTGAPCQCTTYLVRLRFSRFGCWKKMFH